MGRGGPHRPLAAPVTSGHLFAWPWQVGLELWSQGSPETSAMAGRAGIEGSQGDGELQSIVMSLQTGCFFLKSLCIFRALFMAKEISLMA